MPFPESSLNDEAGKLFMDSYEEFSRKARIMTEVHAIDIRLDSTVSGKASASTIADFIQESSGASGAHAGKVSAECKSSKKTKDAKTKGLKRL